MFEFQTPHLISSFIKMKHYMHSSIFSSKRSQSNWQSHEDENSFLFFGAHACRESKAHMHQYLLPMCLVTVHHGHLTTFQPFPKQQILDSSNQK